MESFLVGECGKTIKEAGFTTAREIRYLYESWTRKERQKWEIARWRSFMDMRLSPYIKPHNKPDSPDKWLRFDWEQDKAVEAAKEGAYSLTDAEITILEQIRRDFYDNGKDRGTLGEIKS